jgi:hypothetical protein
MLRDKDGNRLFRTVKVKVVYPDKIFPDKTLVQHAGPHQGFGPNGIDDILMKLADQLDTLYPFWDFKAVELTPEGRTARYVFTFAGYRAVKVSAIQDNPKEESTTLEPGVDGSSTPTEVGTPLAIPTPQE